MPIDRPTDALDGNGVELKPCPFCGGSAEVVSGGPGNHFVQCMVCRATSDDVQHDRAVIIWNRRTPLASSQTAVEPVALAQALKNLAEGAEREDREILYAAASALTEQTAAREAAEKIIHDAECTLYGKHERGFPMKPLIAPPPLSDAINAAIKGAHDDAIRKAAEVANKRISEIVSEEGSYEPDTNYTNLPEWAETVCEELETLSSSILALLSDAPKTGAGG